MYTRGPAWFQSPIVFATVQSSGEQGWNKKGNTVLDKEINHKVSRGTRFRETQFQLEDTRSTLIPGVRRLSFISFPTDDALTNVG